jgi:hypothetical protein
MVESGKLLSSAVRKSTERLSQRTKKKQMQFLPEVPLNRVSAFSGYVAQRGGREAKSNFAQFIRSNRY